MDPKPRPNHAEYLEVLRRMTPEQKLRKVWELSALAKRLFIHRLRQRAPDLSEEAIHALLLARLVRKSQRELLIYSRLRSQDQATPL
jgi:hypothetical protein